MVSIDDPSTFPSWIVSDLWTNTSSSINWFAMSRPLIGSFSIAFHLPFEGWFSIAVLEARWDWRPDEKRRDTASAFYIQIRYLQLAILKWLFFRVGTKNSLLERLGSLAKELNYYQRILTCHALGRRFLFL